jgi:hypothetical protein
VIGVQRDVALDVDEPLMEQVGLGDPAGQPAQGRVLGGKELARGGLELPLGALVDAITPGAGLAVGVGPVGESGGQEKPRSMKRNIRSTRPERLASPTAWATKVKPKRSAKAAISGTGSMADPVPVSTTTWVLSIMQVWQAPSM